jgi:hypothetical protein
MLELASVEQEPSGRWAVRVADGGAVVASAPTEHDALELADLVSFKLALDADGAIPLQQVVFRLEAAPDEIGESEEVGFGEGRRWCEAGECGGQWRAGAGLRPARAAPKAPPVPCTQALRALSWQQFLENLGTMDVKQEGGAGGADDDGAEGGGSEGPPVTEDTRGSNTPLQSHAGGGARGVEQLAADAATQHLLPAPAAAAAPAPAAAPAKQGGGGGAGASPHVVPQRMQGAYFASGSKLLSVQVKGGSGCGSLRSLRLPARRSSYFPAAPANAACSPAGGHRQRDHLFWLLRRTRGGGHGARLCGPLALAAQGR